MTISPISFVIPRMYVSGENGRIMHIFIILFICMYFNSLAKLASLKSTLIQMVEHNMKEELERRDWRKENEIPKLAFLIT